MRVPRKSPPKRETESAAMTTPSDDRFSQHYDLSDSPSMFAAMYYLLVIVDQLTGNIADLEITVYDKSVLRFSRFFINPHPVIRFSE